MLCDIDNHTVIDLGGPLTTTSERRIIPIELVKNRTFLDCTNDGQLIQQGLLNHELKCQVRQETLDTLTVLHMCAARAREDAWLFFMEDDMTACLGALQTIHEVLSSLERNATSIARFAKFSRGWAIPAESLNRFHAYTLDYLLKHPIDAIMEMYKDQYQGYYQHPSGSLFNHLGKLSSFDWRNQEEWWRDKLRDENCGSDSI